MTDKEKLEQIQHPGGSEIKCKQETLNHIYENMIDEKQRYLDGQKKNVADIEEKIAQLIKIKNEKQKLIPEMDPNFAENFCLEELSRILSEGELELVKKGNKESWNLYECYKSTGSYKNELANKLMERLKTLSDDKKLIFAKYLSGKHILLFSSAHGGFFHYSDDISSNYMEITDNLSELGLDKYVRYVGDLCYDIDDATIQAAKERVFQETFSQNILSVQKEIEKIDEELKELEFRVFDIDEKMMAVDSYGLPVDQAVAIAKWTESLDGKIVSEFSDNKERVYVYLSDYSYYPGGGCGIEYGVKIFVRRGSKEDMMRIVYRDAYSSRGDDRSKAYNSINKVKVMDDKIVVTVSSSISTDDYTFGLGKQEGVYEKLLSMEEQKKFEEHIKEEKERLIQENTRKFGMMPSNYDLVYMQIPGAQIYDKKYEDAEVIDESINLLEGKCYIVIKTQIDANAAYGMQFAWIKYEITPTSTKLIGQQTAYQSELMSGKRINIRAK